MHQQESYDYKLEISVCMNSAKEADFGSVGGLLQCRTESTKYHFFSLFITFLAVLKPSMYRMWYIIYDQSVVTQGGRKEWEPLSKGPYPPAPTKPYLVSAGTTLTGFVVLVTIEAPQCGRGLWREVFVCDTTMEDVEVVPYLLLVNQVGPHCWCCWCCC